MVSNDYNKYENLDTILKRVEKLEDLVGNCKIICDIENKSILFRYRDDNGNLIQLYAYHEYIELGRTYNKVWESIIRY